MESRVKLNREIYMKSLRERLRKLPKEDLEMAMEYFQEYFDEAGPENEAQAIEDLGTPQQAADQIIMNLAARNCEEVKEQGVKRSLSSVWIGILAVFAAPIAIPLAFAFVATVGCLGMAVVLILFSLALSAAALVVTAAVGIIFGGIMIFQSPANAIATVGIGFIALGVGLFVCPLLWDLTKKSLQVLTRILGNMVRKFARGERKHEEQ